MSFKLHMPRKIKSFNSRDEDYGDITVRVHRLISANNLFCFPICSDRLPLPLPPYINFQIFTPTQL